MQYLRLFALGGGLLLAPGVQARSSDLAQDERLLKDAHIAVDGPGLLAYFRQRTVGAASEARVRDLIKQLGDDDFNKREDATQQLVAIGTRARPALEKAKADADIEVARRAEGCVKKIDEGAAAAVVAAGVRTLAHQRPPGAVEVLLGYLPSAEDDIVSDEIHNALTTLAVLSVREGKADPALVAALGDPLALKRAAAAVALCRARAPGQMPAVRKVLQDADPVASMRVALALMSLRDKDAVPVLIGLLARLDARERGIVEELLHRLAGDKAPRVVPGADVAARKKNVDAWLAWWQVAGPTFDAAQLEAAVAAARPLNYTLVVLLDENRIIDLDERNRERWQVANLQFPLDAQWLPGDRVLVAEHHGNRVTERNKQNVVVWSKPVAEPIMAQRLGNGNTFIAARTHLLECDKDGKVVFQYQRPGGEQLMKAQKLHNGDIACICQAGLNGLNGNVTRFVRLDATGKELQNFGVDLRLIGGRIDVLANGHVLVPEMTNNRVVEYDAKGRLIWQLPLEEPIAAVRLPNGNTLVTLMKQNRAVEVDRAGKEVWSYLANTRVTRAFRR